MPTAPPTDDAATPRPSGRHRAGHDPSVHVVERPRDASVTTVGGPVGVGRSVYGWTVRLVGLVIELPRRLDAILDEVDDLLAMTRRTIIEVNKEVDDVRAVRAAAGEIDRAADATSRTVDDLLARYEPAARDLAPIVRRVVDELTRDRVDAAITLVDQLPEIVGLLKSDVLPVLETLDQVAPDLHELLELARRGRQAADGVPGTTYLRKRGAAKSDHPQ